MQKKNCKFCGRIGYKCPNKTFDGLCISDGIINENGTPRHCGQDVVVENENMQFFVKYLYTARSDKPRQIMVRSEPVKVYPDNLYCTLIDTSCPYQSPGGKCTIVQFLEGREESTVCDHQMYLDQETELVTRLIQYVHMDIDKLKKEKAKLQKQIEELRQIKK